MFRYGRYGAADPENADHSVILRRRADDADRAVLERLSQQVEQPLGPDSVLLGNRADHAAWIPRREDLVRDVASDDAAGADHAPRSDHYPGENDRVAADPHVGADRDRPRKLTTPSGLGVRRDRVGPGVLPRSSGPIPGRAAAIHRGWCVLGKRHADRSRPPAAPASLVGSDAVNGRNDLLHRRLALRHEVTVVSTPRPHEKHMVPES